MEAPPCVPRAAWVYIALWSLQPWSSSPRCLRYIMDWCPRCGAPCSGVLFYTTPWSTWLYGSCCGTTTTRWVTRWSTYKNLINIAIFTPQVAIRASFLGFTMAVSTLVICFAPTEWQQFGVYGCFMSFFHYSEFLVIACANPRTLSLDSFMLNHSVHYGLAAAASWIEFSLEIYFLPEFKRFGHIWLVGVLLCSFGEVVRKAAIITAGRSFTHLVS